MIALSAPITMASSALRIKEFITMVFKACKDQFPQGLPPTSMESGAPLKEYLIKYESDQKDREAFQKFHEEVVKPDFSTLTCQCELAENASEYLSANKIPFDEAQAVCDCNETFKLPVPKTCTKQRWKTQMQTNH